MYSDVDYCRHKTVLSQFKNLTRLFILLTSIISSFAFASDLAPPKDYRADSIINDVKNSKYSSATGKNYTVGGVSSNNGTVSARVDQRVVVGGSSAEVKTKVSFPADFKDVARTAGKLARTAGGLYLADKAFQGLMDGVDYVMDPKNNTIVKFPMRIEDGIFNFTNTGSFSFRMVKLKAAAKGNPEAEYNLGYLYYYGYGVEKNLEKAKYWLQRSAAKGFEDAKKFLEDF